MSEDFDLVRQWFEKAENDFLAAECLLLSETEATIEAVCFHSQQGVEKYVKAVLTLHGIEFPKTHDIANVISRLPDPEVVGLSLVEEDRLTDYATVTRYPGDYDPITLEEARAAVELARRARASLRKLLPAEVCGE